MKKILVSVFLLVFGLCLAGCETIIEYASLSSITKDEEFTSAYISSVNGDAQVLPVDFNDLKEKEFYKNIMNSSAKPTDVLPEVVPMWSLVIKSDSNQLVIDNLGNLYAEFNDNWYHILCSENDYVALDEFLFPTDSNLTIADLIDTLEFDEVTLKKGDLSLGWTKNFNELKNQPFYNDLMKVTVYSSETTLEKMTMVDVDYYLNFYIKDSEDFFSIRIYGVHSISAGYVICLTKSNVMNDLYEFTMSSRLFNQIYDYFSGASKLEVAKFTEIEDIELLSFYNETMVINSVDGFPFIVTTDDLQTSQQLSRVHERYNEEFFEHYALMIVAFDTCLTEEIIGTNDIKFDGEKFIAIFDVTGVPITDDISTRHFVFKINKLAFQNMDKQSYHVDIKVNNLDNIGSGSAYYDEYFTPVENIVDKTYVYEYEGFGGPFDINIFSDGTFMYYVGMLSSYIGHGNWEYTNGVLTLTDVLDKPQFINKFYVKDNYLIYIAEGSTNFMYLKVSDGAKFNVLTIEKKSFYKLTIQNETDYELIGIKNEYKVGEEVEVKMIYEDDVCTFAFLDGELLGELNGINSIKFNMPAKDSVLTISYSDEIYKVNVIDNFGLLIIPLKQYHAPGETVQVITKFLSGPSVDVTVDGQFLEVKEAEAFGYYGYEFVMPEKDVEIVILYNELMNKPCEDNAHKWDEGIEIDTGTGTPVVEYTCRLCGNKYRVTLTIPVQPSECPYVWKTTEESHTLIMLCDCHRTPAVEEPHKDLDKNHYCDECGYVVHMTGINGMYTPTLLASLDILKPTEKGNEILENFALWIQNDILYINSSIFADGKIGEFTLGERKKLSDEYRLDEFDYVNDEAKDLVKEIFEQESYYAIAIWSYPENVPGHYLIELNDNLYYVYTLFTLGVNGSRDTVLVFKLNK